MKIKSSSGFTIIELLITLVVLAVVVAVAVPSFTTIIEKRRISTRAATVSSTFTTARSEALSQLRNSTICWNSTAVTLADNDDGVSIEAGDMTVYFPPVAASGVNPEVPLQVISNIQYDDGTIVIVDDNDDNCVAYDAQGRITGETVIFGFCRRFDNNDDSLAVTSTLAGRSIVQSNDIENAFVIDCP